MFRRAVIRDGDTTDRDGIVHARTQQPFFQLDGVNAAFEGDPVWCPSCQSHGATKCVQPFRPFTAPDGRQQLLDGDLCLCRCPTPARLKARHQNVDTTFSEAEIRAELTAAAGWVEYAGLAGYFRLSDSVPQNSGSGASFAFVGSETGLPLAHRKFLVESYGSIHEGKTDEKGIAVVHTKPGEEFKIHLVFNSPQGEVTANPWTDLPGNGGEQ
ncbi:PAAR domain-containing protein [Xylophilus sp. GOD-11R]|uniref:PAAR domain-containing protein n=1 Tax=Xylophilus sp. GOD-11R TaxID=3089814 RepID=UPI00298C9F18|nr:PAAR domain-containing protein [Xylophilus sp. GOD-11R]WPB57112.1 PAAR domain-containing protein [Xylophilus sp. GOD-11R]